MRYRKEEVLERFIYEMKWLGKVGKVVSVCSIKSLLVLTTIPYKNLNCYFMFRAREHINFSCAGRI